MAKKRKPSSVGDQVANPNTGSHLSNGAASTNQQVGTNVAETPHLEIGGGLNPMDLSNPKTRSTAEDLAQFAVNEINREPSRAFRQNLIQVVKAYKQVVAGLLYHITFVMGQSTCPNTPVSLFLLSLSQEFSTVQT